MAFAGLADCGNRRSQRWRLIRMTPRGVRGRGVGGLPAGGIRDQGQRWGNHEFR